VLKKLIVSALCTAAAVAQTPAITGTSKKPRSCAITGR